MANAPSPQKKTTDLHELYKSPLAVRGEHLHFFCTIVATPLMSAKGGTEILPHRGVISTN